ncbi:hypothetical protein C1280_11395 [Gemmata obscuriglobus]|uniref:Uncharacterized protein n=1 Tax=Gemmata obscuriglobus TaxID=114 RepID=A0A2Z3H366_9BACT|nr:hypothetical protein C1280_11395 [Gemmata obscuriglobus]
MRPKPDGGVRCSAGFGSLTSAPRIRGSPPTGAGGRSTTDPMRRVAAHRRPPTATRGDEPRPAPPGTTRSHHRPAPPCPHAPPATTNRTSRR